MMEKVFTEECQLINVGLLQLENQHFAITIVILDSGNNHQQM